MTAGTHLSPLQTQHLIQSHSTPHLHHHLHHNTTTLFKAEIGAHLSYSIPNIPSLPDFHFKHLTRSIVHLASSVTQLDCVICGRRAPQSTATAWRRDSDVLVSLQSALCTFIPVRHNHNLLPQLAPSVKGPSTTRVDRLFALVAL